MAGASRVPSGYYLSAAFMDGGFFLIMAAMPFRILDLGGGGLALGMTAAVGAVAYIVAAPVAGRLSDRWPRRRLAGLGATALVGCAMAAWLVQRLDLLVALQLLMGLGKALYWPPVQATLGDLSIPADRGDVLGRFNVAWSTGKGLGFVAGGLLLAHAGFEAAYLAGAASVVAAAACLPYRPASPAPTTPPDPLAPPTTPLPAGFLAMSWLANTAAYAGFGILTYHLPQYIGQQGWQADTYGWFMGIVLVSQTLMFLWMWRRGSRPWSPLRLWWPQLAAALALAWLPGWDGSVALLLTAPLIGLGCGVSYQASITASLADAGTRGRHAGVHEGLIGAGGFAPPLLAGVLVRSGASLAAPYVLAAGLMVLALIAQAGLHRRARHSATLVP